VRSLSCCPQVLVSEFGLKQKLVGLPALQLLPARVN